MERDDEEEQVRSVALQNAQSILSARQRAEQELIAAKGALERRSEELAHSLAMMRATLESTADGILAVDGDGQITDFNQQFVAMWRLPREVMDSRDGRRVIDEAIVQLKDAAGFLSRTKEIDRSAPAESFDLFELIDGRVFERVSRLQRIDDREVGRVWSYRDITERRTAEEKLRQQREWFEVTLSSIGDAVITTDTESRVTFLNPVAESLTGWTSGEAAGHPLTDVFQIVNEQTRAPAANPVGRVLREGITVGLVNHTALISRDGRETSIEDSAAPIRDAAGTISGAVMVFYDVTERRRAEEALRASHDQFSAMINQSPVGVYLVDAGLRLRHVNPKAQPMFGEIENLIGRALPEVLRILWTPEVADEVVGRFRHTLATAEPFFSTGFSELRADRHVQEYYDWELHRITMPDGQQGVVCYFIDISAHVLAQEELRHSEEELRALADSIPQLAWMANPDGSIFWYNQGWYEYTGTTFEQVQGWGWQAVHDPETLPLVVARWDASIRTGTPFEMEFPMRGADGVFRWFLTRVKPVRDTEGKVLRWFGTNTDVDEVKRAREALQDETRILELLNDTGRAIASKLDLELLAQTVTEAATKLSGAMFGAFFYKLNDAEGESFRLCTFSGASAEASQSLGDTHTTGLFRASFEGKGVVRSEDITKDLQHLRRPLHLADLKDDVPVRSYLAVPIISRSGEAIGGLIFMHSEAGVFTERTERLIVGVAAQAAVAIDNARLYEAAQLEITERKRAEEQLAEARDAAEKASQAKDLFLATLSHELRTPLTPVLAILSSIRRDPAAAGHLSEDLETVRRNVELEARLIDDLLDLTRITSGKLTLHRGPVRINRIIEDAINTCLAELHAKRQTLVRDLAEVPDPIMVDSARTTQIVWNLLKNAIKFTPHDGTITIRSRIIPAESGEHLSIEIRDTGIGIEPAKLDRVFEAFEQGDPRVTRQFGGLGLGLAISKAIAVSHGGTLTASSTGPGHGCTFTLTLPLVRHDSETSETTIRDRDLDRDPGPGRDEALAAKSVRILLVEDHPDTAAVLSRLLRRMGHHVIHAGTIAAARHVAEREMRGAMINLVISDLGLPDGSGLDLMRDLSSTYNLQGIALSGFGMEADVEQSSAAGFARHLTKPVDIALVSRTIAELVDAD